MSSSSSSSHPDLHHHLAFNPRKIDRNRIIPNPKSQIQSLSPPPFSSPLSTTIAIRHLPRSHTPNPRQRKTPKPSACPLPSRIAKSKSKSKPRTNLPKPSPSASTTLKSLQLDFLPFPNLETAVQDDVKYLQESNLIPDGVTVSGWVYDVESGRTGRVV